MSTFSEIAFAKKLSELNGTQQSIQTLSLWLVHHRKSAKTIVQVWQTQLIQIKIKKKLTFLYLANDVIQTSRKKGTEFTKAFGGVLITAFTHVSKHADEKTLSAIHRMLNIWDERKIYSTRYIEQIKQAVKNISQKKAKVGGSEKKDSVASNEKRKLKDLNTGENKKSQEEQEENENAGSAIKRSRLQELINQNEEEEYLSNSPVQLPKPDELVKALNLLENAPSSDAVIREKISQLPQELQDVIGVEKIVDKKYADQLSQMVTDAVKMLSDYNKRLEDEVNDRRKTASMLNGFLQQQKDEIVNAENQLKDTQELHNKYKGFSIDLHAHVESLPDLSMLPTGKLAPLPSAGDLFN